MSLKYLLLFLCFAVSQASAAVMLSFSKSDANTLVITVSTEVAYTILDLGGIPGSTNSLVIKGAGGGVLPLFGVPTASPSLTDDTSTVPLSGLYTISPFPIGDVAFNDLMFTTTTVLQVVEGEVVTLSSGTFILPGYTFAAPADGMYDTYLVMGSGMTKMSTSGEAVPEASVMGLAGLAAVGLLRRRRI